MKESKRREAKENERKGRARERMEGMTTNRKLWKEDTAPYSFLGSLPLFLSLVSFLYFLPLFQGKAYHQC
jgi:hypothetical protein